MKDSTMVITPEARLVWPDLFEPVSFKNDDELYRCVLLIPKETDLTSIDEAIRAAAFKKWPHLKENDLKKLRSPIRDGDEKAIDDSGEVDKASFFFNHNFLSVKSKYKPPIVNVYNDPIINAEEIYGGCYVKGFLSFFGYDYMGNKGVSCSLRALIKLRDGDPIGGGKVDTGAVFANEIQKREQIETVDDLRY